MDIEYASKVLAILVTAGSASFAALQAGLSWREKTMDQQRQRRADQAGELIRLHDAFRAVSRTFSRTFDYTTKEDDALRLGGQAFSDEEEAIRTKVDAAFEFLRQLHTSVRLGLIDRTELKPWIYWIHRVDTRPPLLTYSRACAYEVFREDLKLWTQDSLEFTMLKAQCPWWSLPDTN